ncbi:hypothetical protein Y032_0033g2660 [Ancylostoma ceylanicum]|uniref:Uncharacterized protein n=1 Tax=Ancylostoma ceylanicum TaxID=53326 RepID=A0A016UNE4_9BILA|nr:hypothetical protein Y032_0033g2660 [Ancylostoma ceylanicum]
MLRGGGHFETDECYRSRQTVSLKDQSGLNKHTRAARSRRVVCLDRLPPKHGSDGFLRANKYVLPEYFTLGPGCTIEITQDKHVHDRINDG